MIFIQESKMEMIDSKIIRTIWKDGDLDFRFSPSLGNSGGLFTIWKKSNFDLKSATIERHWIMISGTLIPSGFECSFVNIYNPCDLSARNEVWSELTQACKLSESPCLLIGDFNEVLDASERGSQIVSTNGINAFKSFLQDLELMEIPSSNSNFTWFRGQSKSNIDRMFIHSQWLTIFPALQISHLKRSLSDHCPILVQSKVKNWGPRPFRFVDAWLTHPGCMKLIKETWSQSGNCGVMEKMKRVKSKLKCWNVAEFGHIDKKIQELENKIQNIDSIANDRLLVTGEIDERRDAQMELWQWMKRKESFWAQQSRSKWLREGDRNTRYFHVTASLRRRNNNINSLTCDNRLLDTPEEIKEAAVIFFRNLFKEEHKNRPVFGDLHFKKLNLEQGVELTAPFSHSEIDEAVASCDSSKAPGPDGFNFKFVKNAWEVIKEDVYNTVNEFWGSSRLPHGCNTAFIALIPKISTPESFKDFRPISMVGCVYKIISKMLARRLQTVMNTLIGPHQSSFIKGRQILDGALIAGEIIDSCKKNKNEAVILKLDFHKAFDSVSWDFIEWTLEQMNFPEQWRKWMKACVMSANASILINGSQTVPIKLHWGLRQGDPLSPFLFDIIAEPLNLLINKAVSLGLWEGVKISKEGFKLTHLQYADDTVIFCPPNLEFLSNIKKTLILFQLASGLQVNFHKSSLIGVNVNEDQMNVFASHLLCKVGKLPFIYLGLPIGGNMSQLKMWDPIIKKIEKKLSSWKSNLLSIGG